MTLVESVVPWVPPSANTLSLRMIARRIATLVDASTAEKNRLHAAGFVAASNSVIRSDIKANLRQLDHHIAGLAKQAISP